MFSDESNNLETYIYTTPTGEQNKWIQKIQISSGTYLFKIYPYFFFFDRQQPSLYIYIYIYIISLKVILNVVKVRLEPQYG